MSKKPLTLTVLQPQLAVCRLSPTAPFPEWTLSSAFFNLTRTEEELSVVCEDSRVPEGITKEGGWRALKVEGPLDFALTGILAGIAGALARAEISIFAISTYDTDYILVRGSNLAAAVATLQNEGYQVRA